MTFCSDDDKEPEEPVYHQSYVKGQVNGDSWVQRTEKIQLTGIEGNLEGTLTYDDAPNTIK